MRCCIVGAGPAGMMLGFLLARAGVEVVILEKHADFFRDFRGDTIHPSTLEVIAELGILEEFLKRPHQEVREARGQIGRTSVTLADFSHLPTRCKFIALMPQWDFLTFLAQQAARYPGFQLRMQTEAVDLIQENGRVTGVRAKTPDGVSEITADLVIGADGRHSIVREKAGFEILNFGAPIDVLWMRLSRQSSDPQQVLGSIAAGKILVMLYRGDYWQCAYVIPKGELDEMRKRGLPAFRDDIVQLAPFMRDRVHGLSDWNDIKLLTVIVDRLKQWFRAGLLCIGDAAHAMSPIGGVGINLAIQDAVAAANLLALPLSQGRFTTKDLARVQQRREFPTRITQRTQVVIQNEIIKRALGSRQQITSLPFPVTLLQRWPLLRRIPARLIGLGVRPEHVRTPELHAAQSTPAPGA